MRNASGHTASHLSPPPAAHNNTLRSRRAGGYWPDVHTLSCHHRRALRLAIDRLKQSPLATALTIIVIAIALALPTSFLGATGYLQSVAGQWHQQVHVTLYLQQGISAGEEQQIVNTVTATAGVAKVRVISPDAGLKALQQQMDTADLISHLTYNPLPTVIEITPTATRQEALHLERLVNTLKPLPGVEQAKLDREWVERLLAVLGLIDSISAILGFALAMAVFLTIANTLRLILKKYQKEIELMNLLGAKRPYIRRPYVYMGLLYGLGGALLAWLLLTLALAGLHRPLTALANTYQLPLGHHIIPLGLLPGLLCAGGLLGGAGAWITVSRDVNT